MDDPPAPSTTAVYNDAEHGNSNVDALPYNSAHFNDLDDDIIASMAHDHTSGFSLSPHHPSEGHLTVEETNDIVPAQSQHTPSPSRPSKTTLKQCHESFLSIEKTFDELARLVKRPVSQVKNWFYSGMRDSRSTNKWDLYRAYFKNHRDGELERCGLEDGNDVDCWPTFRTQYSDSTEAFLRVALDLDCPANYGVTPQKRSPTAITKLPGALRKDKRTGMSSPIYSLYFETKKV
ncbi:hypothetical protein C0992_012598 [Termitomyces sp. T32_za158]|nr:hypothetical protein C0992_012598 [Termitomyces sp. T32_za158]